MPILFNTLLLETGLLLNDVRLLRHADTSAIKGRSPFDLWQHDRAAFDLYQSIQSIKNRASFGNANHWASFAATADGDTVFLGIYCVRFKGLLDRDTPKPHAEGFDKAGTCHSYKVMATEHYLNDYGGRLYIDWGFGTRAWIQRPDHLNKPVIELRRELKDPDFPGFNEFIEPLSRIETLPNGWQDALRSSRGIYLLTCPRTKEQYVGKADGGDGFLGRWLTYTANSHGGNVELKSREPSDYQISVLEVAGSMASAGEILEMESRWKKKLQSREMGLNKN